MSQITASELLIKVDIDDREALAGLNRLSDAVEKFGATKIAPDTKNSLGEISVAAKTTGSSMDDLSRAAAKVRIDKLTSDISVQSGRLEILKQKLDAARNSKEQDSVKTRELELAVEALSARLRNSESTLELQRKKLGQVGTQLEETASNFSSFGEIAIGGLRKVGEYIASNLVPALGKVISIGADFEQTMNVLQAASGASASEVQQLSDKAKALGADLSLPGTSASDAATAMLELSKAGLDVNETLAASKGVLQLSAAAQIDNATAATITANALNAFNLSGDEASRVANLLAGGANASSASITDLAQGMQQAGFMFHTTGQSVDDLITAVSALTNVGLSGSDGATALKNAMMQLMAPTDGARATMEQYGINVRDAQGNMLPFVELIGHLKEKLDVLSPAQRDMALKTMVQGDGMKALIPLLELGTDGFANLSAKVHANNAAGKMAQSQMQGLNGAVQGLQSQLETAALNGIEPLLPLFTAVVNKLSEFAGWVSDRIGPAMTNFVAGLKLVYNGAKVAFDWIGDNGVAILTGLEMAVGALAATFIIYNTAAAASAVASAAAGVSLAGLGSAAAFGATAVAMAAAPFIALAGAIGLVVYAANEFQNVQEQITGGVHSMLMSEDYFAASTSAIDKFITTQGGASEQTKQTASELDALNTVLENQALEYTRLGAAGALTAEGEKERLAEMQKTVDAIKLKTTALNEGFAADQKVNQAASASLMAASSLRNEHTGLSGAIENTARSMEKLPELTDEASKAMQKAADGATADFGKIISSNVTFQSTIEKAQEEHNRKIADLESEKNDAKTQKQKDGIDEQIAEENRGFQESQNATALAYAQEQAAQRVHLGQMLLQWLSYQSTINPNIRAHYDELVGMTEERYGIMATVEQKTFASTLDAYQAYADGVIRDQSELNMTLDETEQKYTDQATAAQKLREKYVTEIQTKWDNGGYGTGPEAVARYQSDLQGVEKKVQTEVRLDAAEADAKAANTKAIIDRIPNDKQSKIFLDANAVDTGAGRAKAAIKDIPSEKTVSFKDDVIPAEIRARGYANTLNTVVPKTTTTTATFDGTQAKTDANAIGGELSNGVAAGVAAKAGAIALQLKAAILGAVLVAKAAAAIKSPSKLTDSEIGSPLVEGIAVGMKAKSGMVAKAFGDVIGGGVSEGVQKAAEGISKVSDAISKSMDAMSDIRGFASPSLASIQNFGNSLQEVIVEFSNRVGAIRGRLTDTTAKYAEIVGKIVDTVSKGVDALAKLRGFVAPSRESITMFVDALQMTVFFFHDRAVAIASSLSATSMLFADVANKAMGTISAGVDAFKKLETFHAPSRESLLGFSYALQDVVADFWHRAQEIEYALDGSVELFASTASTAVETIGKGVDSLSKLAGFQNPSRDALLTFSYTLRDVVADFWHRAQEVSYALDGSAELFATTANAALETIGTGVEALTGLNAFQAPSRQALLDFSITIRDVVADFWHRSQEVQYALNESTTQFAETANTAVETIGNGVEGFAKLANFVAPSRDSIASFSLALRDTVAEFATRTNELDTSLFEVTKTFSETAGSVVDTIASGVEAFVSLQTYQGVPKQALELFSADLALAVQLMATMASRFDADGVQVAANFAESAGKIVEPIKSGVEAFNALKDYERVASDRMNALFLDLQLATSLMVAIAAQADTEGVQAAAEFSTSVKTVFDGLKSGVDALDAIREYESVPQERMGALLNDFNAAVGLIESLAGSATGIQAQGATWQNALESFANSIRAGIDAIASLNGLNVNVSASVSASAGATASAGDAGGTPAADGSHAMGLNYVPFDGYRAILHRGETVLTAAEARVWRAVSAESQTASQDRVSGDTPATGKGDMIFNAPLIGGDVIMKDEGMSKEELLYFLLQEMNIRR